MALKFNEQAPVTSNSEVHPPSKSTRTINSPPPSTGATAPSNSNASNIPKPQSEPLPDQVKVSFKKLAAATAALNAASDNFTKQIAQIEALMKPLNIGIECWVNIRDWSTENSRGHWDLG